MKVTVFLVVALAVSFSSALPTSKSWELLTELGDFIELIPKEKMMIIYEKYLATDKEVQNFVEFQSSEDYKKFILGLESVEEFQTLLKFFQDSRIDIYSFLELIHESLNMPPFVPASSYSLPKTGKGLKGFFQELEDILPKDQIIALTKEKLENSDVYRNFYQFMNSADFKKLNCACDASQEFQKVIGFGRERGFDAYLVSEFNLKIFNIKMVEC